MNLFYRGCFTHKISREISNERYISLEKGYYIMHNLRSIQNNNEILKDNKLVRQCDRSAIKI